MIARWLGLLAATSALLATACGQNAPSPASSGGAGTGGGGASSGGGLPSGGDGGKAVGGEPNGGKAAGGEPGGGGGAGGQATRPPALGTPSVWEEVTSAEMDPALFTGNSGFGVGNIRVDPQRPTDLYVGGYGSIWKSTDYGLTWSRIESDPNPPSLALGHVLAVAGTTPPTLWVANVNGEQKVFKSSDGGLTFRLTGTTNQPEPDSFYSIVVDPNDPTHLLTGLHEQDNLLESTDGGETWQFLAGAAWPSGGKSWFPFFVDAGSPEATRQTWFAIAQDGGSAVLTTDGGATWTEPTGLAGLMHPHGSSGFYQDGMNLFVAGVGGPEGDGVYRSTDRGASWARVAEGSGNVVWGTPKSLYAMWGWACASCGRDEGGPQYQTAPQPGTVWTKQETPEALDWGPNSVAVTSDGERSIIVGSMWASGLWRYVEP